MTTFLTSAPRRVNAARRKAMDKIVREAGPRYWIATGRPEMNQAAYVLCFHGAREHADATVIAHWRIAAGVQ